ncbi:uncharacterized protein KQ657_004540 [Scheffersomyces spartinae]|uniref:Oxo-4-hydroxy-4-carboxy-5-ureidoimidazoline decarboxylase domain-containing protein n=1 Tax=Scheffersomyces spartinae TaxID=45513 RepID=A0A9P7VAP7_9ASCO|nr:uncharacterized protein KQ657_004540 [Scheffersomyces spartinae]KAG7194328.1 hypothetical protein KQ657_004540 [Scheffersomyces spartinae]
MSYTLPPIEEIGLSLVDTKTEICNHLFEPCSTLTAFILAKVLTINCSFNSYGQFIEAARIALLQFLEDEESKEKKGKGPLDLKISQIIAAHPRLGASKTTKLSSHSATEQKSLQAASDEETKALLDLNNQYETAFPGLRYVVFVNGRPRSDIMENMKMRIARNDISLERKEAFNAMCDIALDRAFNLGAKL